jgi:hypothetical protein
VCSGQPPLDGVERDGLGSQQRAEFGPPREPSSHQFWHLLCPSHALHAPDDGMSAGAVAARESEKLVGP